MVLNPRRVHHRFRNRSELAQVFDYILQGGGAAGHSLLVKGIIGKTYANRSDRRSAAAVIPREVEGTSKSHSTPILQEAAKACRAGQSLQQG